MSLSNDLPAWEREAREAHQYNLDASARQGNDGERRYARTPPKEPEKPVMTHAEYVHSLREMLNTKKES